MASFFHADDYGITFDQSRAILSLSKATRGHGALNSISIFANSPSFSEAASLAAPFVEGGSLHASVHLNLVEGYPCADPLSLSLLVDSRGAFCHDFVGLLRLSLGRQRQEFHRQVSCELAAQIDRFLSAFPREQQTLRADSHQHTHAIPAVFDALMDALDASNCTLGYLRTPVEPLSPHLSSLESLRRVKPVNLAKDALLSLLWHTNRMKMPQGCATALFCGVVLSGRMEQVDMDLVRSFEKLAHKRGEDLEILFHPISVPRSLCLDPQNEPFARACASPSRDAEARAIERLGDVGDKLYAQDQASR